jgi:HD-like signal output (HDOD) protein
MALPPPRVSQRTPRASTGRAPVSNAARASKDEQVVSAAAARIAQEALRADVSIESLAKLAHADVAFAMRLLALVNSPAFARSRRVTDINQAASLLGVRGVRTVALSLLVSNICPGHESCRVLMANSLRRAVACRWIAAELKFKDLDGCFATGLFLDAGLLQHAQQQRELAVSIASSPAQHRVLREQAEGWTPHPRLGGDLAASYALSPETIDAIRNHHAAEPPSGTLGQIAWLAERVAGVFESPDVERARGTAIEQARHLGLGSAQICSLLAALPGQVAEVAQALGRDVGELHDLDALRNDPGRLLADINQQYEGVIRKLGELLEEKEALTAELQKANDTLASLARPDALTGLPNSAAPLVNGDFGEDEEDTLVTRVSALSLGSDTPE